VRELQHKQKNAKQSDKQDQNLPAFHPFFRQAESNQIFKNIPGAHTAASTTANAYRYGSSRNAPVRVVYRTRYWVTIVADHDTTGA